MSNDQVLRWCVFDDWLGDTVCSVCYSIYVGWERVDDIMTHMHQKLSVLNPQKKFYHTQKTMMQMAKFMLVAPANFFYSAMGQWWTETFLYFGLY